MVIDMPNFNDFFVVCNKCTFFAKTSFVVGRRKTASDFMAEFEEEKKPRKLDRVCSNMLPMKMARIMRMSNFVASIMFRFF